MESIRRIKKPSVIELKRVSFFYGKTKILDSIDLKIYENEFLAIIGPNGAGKTTLLRVIKGLNKISSGEIKILAKSLGRDSIKNIGYVPQIFSINSFLPLSVEEVIFLGRLAEKGIFKKFSQEDRRIVQKVAQEIGITHLLKRPIGKLSGGERRKVIIASVLAQRPKILLLDEPLSYLDIKAQESVLEVIERIYKEEDLTIVVVMHELNLIPPSCQRFVLIKEGKVLFDGLKKELGENKNKLSFAYGCSLALLEKRWLVFREC